MFNSKRLQQGDTQLPDKVWPSTEQTLIRKISDRGNHVAWKTFVDVYHAPILNYAKRKYRLQAADAQDAVADVFASVARSIETYDRERPFRNWLRTIARNAIIASWKKTTRTPKPTAPELLDHNNSNDQIWDEEIQARILNISLERIRQEFDDVTWHAFQRRWRDNISAKEVATELQVKAAWVDKAKFRVTQRLKKEIAYLADDSLLF